MKTPAIRNPPQLSLHLEVDDCSIDFTSPVLAESSARLTRGVTAGVSEGSSRTPVAQSRLKAVLSCDFLTG